LATKSKATLHDVAVAAKVSIATASKALNGLTVSAANKVRVLKAAEKLGYVVNDTARALRSNRSHTIGLIFSELSSTRGIGLLDSMSATLETAGYSLICATARADAAAYDRLMRRFLERRVDGIFCVSPPDELPSVQRYQSAGIPIVVVTERSKALASLPLIHPSINAATAASMKDVLGCGHRRVLSIDDGLQKYSLDTLDTRLRDVISIELRSLLDVGALDDLVRTTLLQKERPTLISAFQPQAEAILFACRASGVKVPGDFSLIALTHVGNEKRAADLGLSSILFRPELLGAEAATQMLFALDGKKVAKNISVEVGGWTRRRSVGPVG